MSLLSTIKSELNHLPGWHTRKKIVVIESDDWGTIRMPSRSAYKRLTNLGIPLAKDAYCRLDALESDSDLSSLFEVLNKYASQSGQKPIFTANTIVANPDFKKIKEYNFDEYFFEPFTETIKRYPSHSNVISLYQQGLSCGIIKPQLHGREHVNIHQWLTALKSEDKYTLAGFEEETFAISPQKKFSKRHNFMAALDYETDFQKKDINKILLSGLNVFKQIFGYPSTSFIAPTYVWDEVAEQALFEYGVNTLQGIGFQYQPNPGGPNYRSRYRYTGKRSAFNQVYLTRNCFFEPALMPGVDAVDTCMKRIQMAFRWRKPAIIGSHRLNYIGFIDPSNRDRNLKLFDNLLKKITQTWPDVHFMSSDQLGETILSNQ